MSGRERVVAVERRQNSRGKSYRLRWYYAGSTQTTTVATRQEAASAKVKIEALDCNISGRDDRIVSTSLWNEAARAASHGGMTYGEAAELVIAERHDAREQTKRKYREDANSPIRSGRFKDRDLASIETADLQEWVDEMREVGRRESTIHVSTMVCRMVFRQALAKGWISVNPWDGIAKGRDPLESTRDRAKHHVLTPTQVATLVAVTPNARYALLWHVLAHTGMRIGEALGLTVANVRLDGDAGEIHVVQGLSHGGKRVIPVKSRRSDRVIDLDPETVRRLRPFVDGRKGREFVWAIPTTGEPMSYSTVGKVWRSSRTAAGLDDGKDGIRIHDLRHTHASWLLNDGVPVVAVSERLGHGSVKITTDVYGHVDPHGRAAIMRSLKGRAQTAAEVTPLKRSRRRSA